jgi:N-acetylmuramoyl-L-alanine amidase
MQLILAVFVLVFGSAVVQAGDSLKNLVLVLDPGHGGADPGSHGTFKNACVWEDEYVYDVAARVQLFAEDEGAIVYKTVVDPKNGHHRNDNAQDLFENNRDEKFWDGTMVVARTTGLLKRVVYANRIHAQHPGKQIVFLSIHFDVAGTNHSGAYVIVPKTYVPSIADHLKKDLGDLISKEPIRPSGKKVKNIFILGARNGVHEKVLLELGNFMDEGDQWRIRDYKCRNKYALRIRNALKHLMKE